MNAQVLVVGAGPAGLALALRLARAGVAVTLVEACPDPQRHCRGEALMPSGLAALEQLGLGDLLAASQPRPLGSWRFVLDGRELFAAHEPLGGPQEAACTLVSQPRLLQAGLAAAATLPNLSVRLGQTVTDLHWQGERVGGVRLAGGERLNAALVVACDGRHSSLRRRAGLELQTRGEAMTLQWFELTGALPEPLADSFTTVVGDAGIYSVFTAAAGGVRLGWLRERPGAQPDASNPEESNPEESNSEGSNPDGLNPTRSRLSRSRACPTPEALARQAPAALAAWLRQEREGWERPRSFRIQVAMVESWWRPGLLLLGDAAHPMSPVRAQGLNMALRDVAAAAELLVPLLLSLQQPPRRTPHQERGHGAAGAAALAPDGAGASELDRACATIEALRRPEVQRMQQLQAQESRRGELLRRWDSARRLLAAAAPLVGPALREHWRHQQQPLRHGLTPLPQQPRLL